MTIWLKDSHGNKCSVEHFGSRERAQKALDSLQRCRGCVNCSRCINCANCSRCSHCSNCSDCIDCWNCSNCSNCSSSSSCSRCSGCVDCSNCSNCSNCSSCSHCSYCSNCSSISKIVNKTTGQNTFCAPPIPVIENINRKIYEAASKPGALDMGLWHVCKTTHCRAGWATHLAGEAGHALEKFYGTLLAAQLIYRESGTPISPARFFDSDADAMADMKRLAELEAVQ